MCALDTLPGRPRGEGYGLSVRVVVDPVARNTYVSEGTFGWSGLFGTRLFIDPKERCRRWLSLPAAAGTN